MFDLRAIIIFIAAANEFVPRGTGKLLGAACVIVVAV